MLEDPRCRKCKLHETATKVCLPSSGPITGAARLLVLFDYPNFIENRTGRPFTSQQADLVRWMFKRMGIPPECYHFEYVLKCAPPNSKPPKKKADRMQCIESCSQYRYATMQFGMFNVVVGLGRIACEALMGSHELSKFSGTWWEPNEVATRQCSPAIWIGPNPAAVLMNPSTAPELHRVLWAACIHANYHPSIQDIPPFDWSEFFK